MRAKDAMAVFIGCLFYSLSTRNLQSENLQIQEKTSQRRHTLDFPSILFTATWENNFQRNKSFRDFISEAKTLIGNGTLVFPLEDKKPVFIGFHSRSTNHTVSGLTLWLTWLSELHEMHGMQLQERHQPGHDQHLTNLLSRNRRSPSGEPSFEELPIRGA